MLAQALERELAVPGYLRNISGASFWAKKTTRSIRKSSTTLLSQSTLYHIPYSIYIHLESKFEDWTLKRRRRVSQIEPERGYILRPSLRSKLDHKIAFHSLDKRALSCTSIPRPDSSEQPISFALQLQESRLKLQSSVQCRLPGHHLLPSRSQTA
jgi:hypothetical protein